MTRADLRWLLLALAAFACSEETPVETPPGECHGAPPLTLLATPTKVRPGDRVALLPGGGSGQYVLGAELEGSGGQVQGRAFVAGKIAASDTLFVEDRLCGGRATATVQVVPPFGVTPTRATVKPGTSFRIEVKGTLGEPAFALVQNGSGGSVSSDGAYVAGGTEGLDLVEVRDPVSGDQIWLRFRVSTQARFRASPERLALAAGSSVPLATADGTDHVQWSKRSGPGAI
ncbi:MAG: VCBS repeat-containing protein, partial [Myxococcales bacterium]